MPLFQMRFRRDTTANWQAANPILLDGEVGYERTENGLLLTKMGDGVMGADGIITGTSWNDLSYVSGPAGPAPEHEWQQTSLRFKNPDGSWGEAVQLKGAIGPIGPEGPPGPEGTSTPATSSVLGGVMPRAGLTVGTEGYLDHDLAWSNRQCYRTPILVLHNGAAYKWLAVNGLGTDAGVKEPGVSGSENFWKSLAAEALEEVRSIIEEQEFLRKLTIGAPKFHRSTVLPDNHAWPDGSFVEFEDWPEFYEIYEQGGFAGMLMPWDADAATQAANLGKFRPNSANPTGLYLPLHGGQFFRAWTLGADGTAGGYNAPGLPNITGKISARSSDLPQAGAFFLSTNSEGMRCGTFVSSDYNTAISVPTLDASRSSAIYGASATVMPPSVDIPVILYLGRPWSFTSGGLN